MANPESSRPNHLSPNSLTNLRLKKVLKSYQQCAPDSLNGPNYYHPTWINGDHHHQHLHPRGIKYPGEKYANNSNSIGASTNTTSSNRAHSINLTNNNHHHKVISNNATTTATTTTATTTTTTNHNNHNNSNNISHSNKANNINLSDNHHNNSSNHSNHTNNTSPDLLVSLPAGGSSSSSSSGGNIQRVTTCSTLGSKSELTPSGKLVNSDGASKSSSNSNQISISSSNSSNSKISGGREKGGGSSSSSSKTELSPATTPATTTSVTKSSSSSSSSSSTPTAATLSSQVALPPPNIRIPPPIIIPADPDSCQRSETILEGEVISCFIVGGEKRLCLPQVFNSVLTAFSLQQINSVCGELHIFCSRCTPEQLEVLKVTGIIPAAAPSCGLITKTDAERLCAALLFYANRDKMLMMAGSPGVNLTPFAGPPPMMGLDYDDLPFDTKGLPIGGGDSLLTLKTEKLSTGIPVSHKCFGQCSGTLYPDLYTEPTSRCIKCSICGIWLTPQRFVTHIHASTENHTCHWGFDSYNWRAYIHLDDESKEYQCAIDVEQLEAELDSFKSRFDPVNNPGSGLCNNPNVNSPAANKRKLNQSNKIQTEKKDDYDKQSSNSDDDQLLEPLKKIKTEDMPMMKLSPPSAVAAFLTSPYPPPYLPPPPPPSLLPPPSSASSLHHSYHHFPVSTNWTPDPSLFSYWYQHPNLSLSSSTTAPSTSPSPSSGSSSSTIPSSTPTLSLSTSSSACTTLTTITTTANHHNHHPNPSSLDKNRQDLTHHHLLSNLDKLLRTNKVHSDLRVQIFKEIESIIEKVRSTGNDSNVVVDTTPS